MCFVDECLLLVLVACSSGGDGLEMPTEKAVREAGVALEDVGEGYWVFQRKCLECHEARFPEDPYSDDWHATIDGMSWKAGLSGEEERAVLSYLQVAKQ